MMAYSAPMRWIGLVVVLLIATTIKLHAEEQSSGIIDVRWVMAGMEKETDPAQPISIPPEANLRTGDKIKMYLKAYNKCYFYLFYQGPDGKLQLLYPVALPSGALEVGHRLTIPQGDKWFELDEQTGRETFHVLISSTPLRAIETLYTDYLQRQAQDGSALARLLSAIERLRLKQRPLTSKAERPLSIGGTVRGASDTNSGTTERRLDRLAEDITSANVFCRTYTIEHR